MRRLPFVLIIVIFLLNGCLRQSTVSVAASRPLLPIYQEELPITTRFFDFADGGETFLLAGRYSFLHIYDSTTFKKHVMIKEVDGEDEFSVLGAGYIDDNTWYVATGYHYPNPDYKESPPGQNNYLRRYLSKGVVSIRQVEPAREIYNYDLQDFSHERVFANKNHIAYRGTLVNWHNGEVSVVEIAYPVGSYYFTPASQVITRSMLRDVYLFYDPLKKEVEHWHFSFRRYGTELILSRDGRYALFRKKKGSCALWQLTPKKRLGRCGRSKLWGDKISRAVFRRDSQVFAVSAENKITLYSIEPFKSLMTLALKEPVDILALSEEYLAAIDKTGMLRVWSIKENKLLGEYRFSENHSGLARFSSSSRQMAFQPGGSKLVVSNLDQLVVFDLAASLAGSNGE